MTPQEQFLKALKGETYECIFIRDNKFRIVGASATHFRILVTVKKVLEAETGFGKTTTTTYCKWKENEAIQRLKRCFEQGEYILSDTKSLKKFYTI